MTDITSATVRERVEMRITHIPEGRRHTGIAPGLGIPENLALKSYCARSPLCPTYRAFSAP